jgi:hypothetical protein
VGKDTSTQLPHFFEESLADELKQVPGVASWIAFNDKEPWLPGDAARMICNNGEQAQIHNSSLFTVNLGQFVRGGRGNIEQSVPTLLDCSPLPPDFKADVPLKCTIALILSGLRKVEQAL